MTTSSAGPCIDGGPSVDAPLALSMEREVHGPRLTPSPKYPSVEVEFEHTKGPLPTVRLTSFDSDAGVVAGGSSVADIVAAVAEP